MRAYLGHFGSPFFLDFFSESVVVGLDDEGVVRLGVEDKPTWGVL